MSHVNEVGAKLKSALDAIEDAKRALAELDVDDLKALSDSEYEDLLMRMFLASMVRRMAGRELRRTMELMRCSTERALSLLRDVENHVGRKEEDSEGSRRYLRTRAGLFAQIDPRE